MPRTFDGSTESPASVEQIHAAFGREDYWLARLATGETTTELNSLNVGSDGTVTVGLTQYLGRQLFPAPVAKLIGGDVKLTHTETWTPNDDGQVRGQISVSVSGGLGTCRAMTWLSPTEAGSQLRFSGQVEVNIPLVGGNLEKALGTNLAENIPAVVRFTTMWVNENA